MEHKQAEGGVTMYIDIQGGECCDRPVSCRGLVTDDDEDENVDDDGDSRKECQLSWRELSLLPLAAVPPPQARRGGAWLRVAPVSQSALTASQLVTAGSFTWLEC